MKKWLAATLEKALNRYFSLDPESAKNLQKLQGKIVTIELLGIGLTLQMVFSATGVQLKADDFSEPDTLIQGGPISLLHIALARDKRKNLFAENATITGDLDFGQDVMALFDDLEIDWEEHLSHWIGDVPAHQTGRVIRGVKNLSERVRRTMTQNVNEYVHEEIDLFPPSEALRDFFQAVDELRMEVDRINALFQTLRS